MAVRFRSTTTDRVIASLGRYDRSTQDRLRAEMEASRQRAYETQQALCAVDTGRMQRLTRSEMRDDGFRYEMGWTEPDFAAEGQPFYPPFPELGTVKQAAQPSLLPALFQEEPLLIAGLERALRG
jgi:hypothetical protein